MRKVIFLDVDGVLNSVDSAKAGFIKNGLVTMCPWYGARLNKIIEATGAKIVVSSTWRILHSNQELKDFLAEIGVTTEIIGVTPHFSISPYASTERAACRGDEIRFWIASNEPLDSFVILDDSEDMDVLEKYLVRTTWDHGLQDEHVTRAIEILNA